MKTKTILLGLGASLAILGAQEPNPTQASVDSRANSESVAPIYRVRVVARTTKAVNYGHRSMPTKIGLAGTVLLPEAEGEARIQTRQGAVDVEAKLKHLSSPERFGRQYLTYVLWAITPEGRATNLGEIVTDGSNRGELKTASELQTFALVVTAEPYYAVTNPSDVVVMENVILPETTGRIQTVDARYELLQRGEYTLDLAGAERADNAERPKVSLKEYESLLALYQARNAIQLAEVEGAADHAPDIISKAETRLRDAEAIYKRQPKDATVVTLAREAVQMAEDARIVAMRQGGNRWSTTASRD